MVQRPPNASAILHIMQYMTYSLHGDEHGDKNSYILGIQLAFPFVSIFHLGTAEIRNHSSPRLEWFVEE